MSVRALLPALVMALVACPACVVAIGDHGWSSAWGWDGSYDVSSSETRTFDVGAQPDVSVETGAGDVSIVPGPPGVVTLELVRRGASASDLERLDVHVEQVGSSVRVRVDIPHDARGAVDVAVTAPAATLATGAGDVEIAGLTRDVRASTGSGDVEVRNVSGALAVDTGSGDVDVAGAGAGLHVDTGSGDVEARGVRGPSVVTTGSGDLVYEGTPRGDSHLRTGSGDVDVVLEGAALAFSISTGSGDIDLDTPERSGRVEGGRLEGRVAGEDGGEGALQIVTGSGDVSVTSRAARR